MPTTPYILAIEWDALLPFIGVAIFVLVWIVNVIASVGKKVGGVVVPPQTQPPPLPSTAQQRTIDQRLAKQRQQKQQRQQQRDRNRRPPPPQAAPMPPAPTPRRTPAPSEPTPTVVEPMPAMTASNLRGLLRRAGIRDAVVLAEVLGKPKGLQRDER